MSSKGLKIGVKANGGRDRIGDSIAINGVCLTLVKQTNSRKNRVLWFDATGETIERTTLAHLKTGAPVNLERAMKASDSFGGHLVQGHVDGIGRVAKIQERSNNYEVWFSLPAGLSKYLVKKGAVTIDGISLTVVGLKGRQFSVSLIPYTRKFTKNWTRGTKVNIEVDVFAKYVWKYTKKK